MLHGAHGALSKMGEIGYLRVGSGTLNEKMHKKVKDGCLGREKKWTNRPFTDFRLLLELFFAQVLLKRPDQCAWPDSRMETKYQENHYWEIPTKETLS